MDLGCIREKGLFWMTKFRNGTLNLNSSWSKIADENRMHLKFCNGLLKNLKTSKNFMSQRSHDKVVVLIEMQSVPKYPYGKKKNQNLFFARYLERIRVWNFLLYGSKRCYSSFQNCWEKR